MIRYNPPKSQAWGHPVGRLSASVIVDRASQFLQEHCAIITSQPSELSIGWNSSQDGLVSELAAEIDQSIGEPNAVNQRPSVDGQIFRQRRWSFVAGQLPFVATCFDKLTDALKTEDAVAQSSTIWVFAWRDELPPLLPMQSAGGMFGVHLGQPHRITTMFTFRDVEDYLRIKEYLGQSGLAELSDKHVRPKMDVSAVDRDPKSR